MPKIDWDKEQIHYLYWDEGNSATQIGRMLGYQSTTVGAAMRRMNMARRSPSESAKLAILQHGNSGCFPKLENHPGWRGGKMVTVHGYAKTMNWEHPRHDGNGYVADHVLIWEKVNNKPLPDGWVIHHLNGIKGDNRPVNLLALPRSRHSPHLVEHALRQRIRELEAEVKGLEGALEREPGDI